MPLSVDVGPRISRVAIPDELVGRFKELIAKGVFVPGHRLPPERDLAEALAVSRPTLRQALRALQIVGVIRARQGSGSYLADNASDIMRVPLEFALALKNVAKTDLFETRCTLEVKLASLAAERRTEDDLEAMRQALREMEKSLGDPEAWCRTEPEFHSCIVQAARNGVMSTIIEMLSQMLMESGKETVLLLKNYTSSYVSHENVYIEIERQDPTAAARRMMEHFSLIKVMTGESPSAADKGAE
ncbi:MAG TPA: FadR/GntR family transcriptional regulator [Candidatus Binatia bacterium]|nr:FadR/GntR family transcriptional regulator [Candidatus Binatia bacterium]